MKRWRVIIAALAVGAAAGWFAAGAWGNCGNVETANDGRARSPVSPERSEPRKRWLQGCAPHGRRAAHAAKGDDYSRVERVEC